MISCPKFHEPLHNSVGMFRNVCKYIQDKCKQKPTTHQQKIQEIQKMSSHGFTDPKKA